MVAPTSREITAIKANIKELSDEQVTILRHILKLLGVNSSVLADVLNISKHYAADLLRSDTGSKFAVDQLIELAQVFRFRPGVVQQKVNFDHQEKAPNRAGWQGPHPLFVDGDRKTGAALKKVVDSLGNNCGLTKDALRQIGNGNMAVTLDQLRTVVAQAKQEQCGKGHLQLLVDILKEKVPAGILTAGDYEQQLVKKIAPETGAEKKEKTTMQETVEWSPDGKRVSVGDNTYPLNASGESGVGMAKVGDHIEAAINSREDASIKAVMGAVNLGFRWLNAVRKGNQAFTREQLEGIALVLEYDVSVFFTGKGLERHMPDSLSDKPPLGTLSSTVSGADYNQEQEIARKRVLRHDVKPAEGVDLREILILALDSGEGIDWVEKWLALTAEGAAFKEGVDAAVLVTKPLGPEFTSLFLRLIRVGMESRQTAG